MMEKIKLKVAEMVEVHGKKKVIFGGIILAVVIIAILHSMVT